MSDGNMLRRNFMIDIIKYIASLLIVAIHGSPFLPWFPWANLYIVNVIGRLAVPFFYICTGFFLGNSLEYENDRILCSEKNKKRFKKQFQSLLLLYIGWSLFYLAVQIPDWFKTGWFSPMAFVDWGIGALKNGSYYHLWYVLCLLYAFPIIYVILCKVSVKWYSWIIGVLMTIEIVSCGYRSLLPMSVQQCYSVYDSFGYLPMVFTRAIPMVLTGVLLSRRSITLKRTIIYGILIGSFMALCIEATIVHCLGGSTNYLFLTIPTAALLFFAVSQCEHVFGDRTICIVKHLGTVSLIVYCVHPALLKWFALLGNGVAYVLTILTATGIGLMYSAIVKPRIMSIARLKNKS